ncbi:MAG: acyltransferase [Candidatus Helarchaeota archaeon]
MKFVDIHPDAKIGKDTKIHSFCYIEGDVIIGDNCNLRPYVYICDGVRIGNNVFIGMGTIFTNDKHPPSDNIEETMVEDDVSIGAGAIILPGLTIGKGSVIGAGAVVTRDVKPNTIVYGNPAREKIYIARSATILQGDQC